MLVLTSECEGELLQLVADATATLTNEVRAMAEAFSSEKFPDDAVQVPLRDVRGEIIPVVVAAIRVTAAWQEFADATRFQDSYPEGSVEAEMLRLIRGEQSAEDPLDNLTDAQRALLRIVPAGKA